MSVLHADSPMQAELRALARKFARAKLLPDLAADERDERFRPEWIRELGALGLTGIPVPETLGGAGLGYSEYVVALEEVAACNLAYAISVAVSGLAQIILVRYGSEELQRRHVPRLAAGEAIGAFSLSEAGSGSDAGALKTTARRDGDGWVVNGTKLWASQADVAEVTILFARTGGPGPKGVSAFAIPRGTPGFRMGKREHKMAMNSSHTMELVFEDCRLPASALVGQEGEGFKIALSSLDSGRITIGCCAVGIARAALEVAVKHARAREQFGKPIGEFQGVSFLLADMRTQLDAARLMVLRAAAMRDAGLPYTPEAAMAKLFATDMAMRVTTDAVQVLGGSGYTAEFPVERYMREAKVLQIVEGTNQIQRLVVGRSLLESDAPGGRP